MKKYIVILSDEKSEVMNARAV